jgi:hypothetical protein
VGHFGERVLLVASCSQEGLGVVATAGSGNRNGTAAAWIRSGVGGAVSAARAHSFSAHAFSDAPIVLGTRFRYRVNGPCTCRFPPHAWRKLFECVTRQLVWGKVRYAGKSLPERFNIRPLRLTALIPGAQNAQGDFEPRNPLRFSGSLRILIVTDH